MNLDIFLEAAKAGGTNSQKVIFFRNTLGPLAGGVSAVYCSLLEDGVTPFFLIERSDWPTSSAWDIEHPCNYAMTIESFEEILLPQLTACGAQEITETELGIWQRYFMGTKVDVSGFTEKGRIDFADGETFMQLVELGLRVSNSEKFKSTYRYEDSEQIFYSKELKKLLKALRKNPRGIDALLSVYRKSGSFFTLNRLDS